ncbi:MAG: DUF485 domain-containing protein [Prolixibacteraceae bacterium]|nr:DUF485 domain-containing protein [Prolixibacteraceae bacterium]
MHGPAVKLGADNAAAKKSKLGVILFYAYTLVYAGFVAIGLVKPELLSLHILRELNLSIIYGFGLIILAIVMGFIYNVQCTRMEIKMNKKQGEKI